MASAPLPSTRTSRLWSTEAWQTAAEAYSKGFTLPKRSVPVEVSPDLVFKSVADVQHHLGLDTTPETHKARLVTYDASYNDVEDEDGPEITYVLVGGKQMHLVMSRYECLGLRRIMLDGKARNLYSTIRAKTD